MNDACSVSPSFGWCFCLSTSYVSLNCESHKICLGPWYNLFWCPQLFLVVSRLVTGQAEVLVWSMEKPGGKGKKKNSVSLPVTSPHGTTWLLLSPAAMRLVALKFNRRLSCVSRIFAIKTREVDFPLWVALARPYLLHCAQFWVPSTRGVLEIGASHLGQVGVWGMWHTRKGRMWCFLHPGEGVEWESNCCLQLNNGKL